jgi:hypothetical protein
MPVDLALTTSATFISFSSLQIREISANRQNIYNIPLAKFIIWQ